ncbi:hypothetical protein D7Y15_13640 [Corallococcus sp. AB030]|uniref:hypothetical protein n=1 Tax=unclassified Corallococcus TaxID=2685029 RepID=UPI000EDC547E|nr:MULTISPECIES: hypothetical protein [unclassified Corallococcus]RKI15479.1 hypothetical protein D7Y15_13640 [Corallococcus sp. AB030]RUO92650.1 hypothetical protein D7Y11_13815 [Corallococcus sp. AB018]
MAEEATVRLLKQQSTSSAYVHVVTPPKPPAELMAALSNANVGAVCALLAGGAHSTVVTDVALDQEADGNRNPAQRNPAGLRQKDSQQRTVANHIAKWGAKVGTEWRLFKQPKIEAFVVSLFQAVKAGAESGNHLWTKCAVTFSRADLFHCHLVYDVSGPQPDILFLFHLKEYPSNIEADKSHDAHLIEPDIAEFTSHEDAGYPRRNAVYSLRMNRLWIINYIRRYDEDLFVPVYKEEHPYLPLLTMTSRGASMLSNVYGNPLAVGGDQLGDEFGTINYFPRELAHPIFAVRGH